MRGAAMRGAWIAVQHRPRVSLLQHIFGDGRLRVQHSNVHTNAATAPTKRRARAITNLDSELDGKAEAFLNWSSPDAEANVARMKVAARKNSQRKHVNSATKELGRVSRPKVERDTIPRRSVPKMLNVATKVMDPSYVKDTVESTEAQESSMESAVAESIAIVEGSEWTESEIAGSNEEGVRASKVSMRLAKFIGKSGLASRREAERWVEEGRVQVNGVKVASSALNVSSADTVCVDGTVLNNKSIVRAPRLWAVYKPKRELVARSDPQNRPCLLQRMKFVGLPDTLKPVGRLDFMTEGIILLTDDGDLARKLEHPTVGLTREYKVRVHGTVTAEKIRAIRKGCLVEGVKYKGMGVWVDRGDGHNTWLKIHCSEGKNNQIRRICKHLNLTVNRLLRTSFGPFKLGKMTPGAIAKLPVHEYFLSKVDAAMETGIPMKPITSETTSRFGIRTRRAKPAPPPSQGLSRVRPSRPSAQQVPNIPSKPSVKPRVKRLRGGGVVRRPRKESAHEKVVAQRKVKKIRKKISWENRHRKIVKARASGSTRQRYR